MGRDHLAAAGGRRLRRAADGQGTAVQQGRDRRVDLGPRPRALDVISRPISTTRSGATRPSRITTSIPTASAPGSSTSSPTPRTTTSSASSSSSRPQGAYPFEVLPDDPVDALFLDGRKHQFRFPNPTGNDPASQRARQRRRAGDLPPAARQGREARGDLFQSRTRPGCRRSSSRPFFDGGQMVTPCYWGSHWPLARGNSTGQDDRRPDPVHSVPQQRDELGRQPAGAARRRPSLSPSTRWADPGR